MRKRLPLFVTLWLLAVAGAGGWWWFTRDKYPPPPPWTAEMPVIADGNNRFAFDLYGKLRESEKGNIFFSPYSAHTALAMTSVGARGVTRDEMVKVLHLPASDEKMLASGDLGAFYAHPRKDFQLSVANALWGQKDHGWRPEFLEIEKTRFGAGFHEADFKSNPDGERQRINRWVEEKTRDKIKELLEPGIINGQTRMVLANAIYFKGDWETQFDPKRTHDAPFTLADGTKIQTPMMNREGKFRHYIERGKEGRWEPEFQVAEIPYKGGELSMVVIVPGKHDGLPALEEKLTPEMLAGWLSNARDGEKTPLALPKFRIETKAMMLKESLQKLGMTAAFGDGADFSGMGPGGLSIAHVVQKAFVDVNEEGTEAAAATVVVMNDSAGPLPFRADRPFLFLIRDAKHGTILFIGRVMNPKG